jgi:hypothetical protein
MNFAEPIQRIDAFVHHVWAALRRCDFVRVRSADGAIFEGAAQVSDALSAPSASCVTVTDGTATIVVDQRVLEEKGGATAIAPATTTFSQSTALRAPTPLRRQSAPRHHSPRASTSCEVARCAPAAPLDETTTVEPSTDDEEKPRRAGAANTAQRSCAQERRMRPGPAAAMERNHSCGTKRKKNESTTNAEAFAVCPRRAGVLHLLLSRVADGAAGHDGVGCDAFEGRPPRTTLGAGNEETVNDCLHELATARSRRWRGARPATGHQGDDDDDTDENGGDDPDTQPMQLMRAAGARRQRDRGRPPALNKHDNCESEPDGCRRRRVAAITSRRAALADQHAFEWGQLGPSHHQSFRTRMSSSISIRHHHVDAAAVTFRAD